MTVHGFIAQRRSSWTELGRFIARCSELGIERVPLDEFQQGSSQYRQAVSDLALARMRYPEHPVVRELEALVGHAHGIIYRSKIVRRGGWRNFWTREYPALVRASIRPILVSALIFWATAILGAMLTLQVPTLADTFVSHGMRQALEHHRLWTEHLTSMAPQAASSIAQNNISVAFMTWALGLSFGIGTVYLLAFNGLMLGAVAVACLRYDMLPQLAEFVIAHGALELPAIWIAGGAGLVMARAMVLPGRYSRRVMLRVEGRKSVRIVIGTIPILLTAALIEGFISPSDLPATVKCLAAMLVALVFVAYLALAGRDATASASTLPGSLEPDSSL